MTGDHDDTSERRRADPGTRSGRGRRAFRAVRMAIRRAGSARTGVIALVLLLSLAAGAGALFYRNGARGEPGRRGVAVASGATETTPATETKTDTTVPAAAACGSGLKSCDGRCVPEDAPEHGCGAEGCDACGIENATARCNALQLCEVDACHPGFADCDGNRGNGCETNLRTDPDHCGSCGARCPTLPHAERGCGGRCTIWRCERGFRDCNAAADDGCEVDVLNDGRHCGHCDHPCGAGRRCEHGRCA
jgi:hypothetical protein